MKMTQKEFDDFCKKVEIVPEKVVRWHIKEYEIGHTVYRCPKCNESVNFKVDKMTDNLLKRHTYCGYCGSKNIIWDEDN